MAESGNPPGDVGYAKPPRNTEFKPGQSGNPRGRPKRAKIFATAIEDELGARVTVTENGKRRKASKREVIAKRLVNRAAEGDFRALPLLLNEARAHKNLGTGGAADEIFGGPEDAEVIAGIVQRIRRSEDPAAQPEPGADALSSPEPDDVEATK
jgi:Family of unknown function (DUF5681)